MKKLIFILTTLAAAFTGCRPDDPGAVLKPQAEVVSSLDGNWQLSAVTQTDNEAPLKNSPFVTKDLTDIFPYRDFKLLLKTSNGAPTDFTVTKGNSPAIIPLNNGTWKVDNADLPKNISFINGTDTVKATIGSYPSSFNQSFQLKVEKKDAATGQVKVIYQYKFTKQ